MIHALLVTLFVSPFVNAADFAGCTDAAFVTVQGNAHIAISGRDYTPKCLRIKAGTTVTVDASAHHPLQGVGDTNPLFDELGGAVSLKTAAFSTPGIYGYFCVAHGDDTGAGMAGAILVE